MIRYDKYFHSNKTMSFKVLKYGKNSSKDFDREPVYGDNDKYIKTEIKSYGGKVDTNFQGKKIPKENTSYKCLSLIMLDSAIRVNKKRYPQTLLEECKYEIKSNKTVNLINDDLDSSSSAESYNESENESEKPSKKSESD